jgi:tetratricopeptide (TPR) repeat protein
MAATILLLMWLQTGASASRPYDRGLEHMQRREFLAATVEFQRAIEVETPGSERYRLISLQLGQAYFLLGRNADAIPWLEKAIEGGAGATEAFYMLGNANLQLQNIDRARGAFARLFGMKEDSAAAHLITAQMLVRQELRDIAQKEAHRALEIDARIPEAHYLLGILATYRSDLPTAIAELSQEIAINPNYAMAYYKLGDAYTRREEWDRAIPVLQKSVWLNPDYSGPYILLGKAYWKRDALSNAEGVLRHAIEIDPKNQSAHYLLGQVLMKMGREEEGRKMIRESQEMLQPPHEK